LETSFNSNVTIVRETSPKGKRCAFAFLTDVIPQNSGDLEAATAIICDIYANVYGLSGDALAKQVDAGVSPPETPA